MIVTEDGGYESASDYDEETLALITSEEHGGDDSDHETHYDEDINTIIAPTAPAAIHTRQITRACARQLNY